MAADAVVAEAVGAARAEAAGDIASDALDAVAADVSAAVGELADCAEPAADVAMAPVPPPQAASSVVPTTPSRRTALCRSAERRERRDCIGWEPFRYTGRGSDD
jgi:hypothetical protein